MDMGIDEAGQNRPVAQVDNRKLPSQGCACCGRQHVADGFAIHDHNAWDVVAR
jgi:hypothetical protein